MRKQFRCRLFRRYAITPVFAAIYFRRDAALPP